jgi:hypothetical protein
MQKSPSQCRRIMRVSVQVKKEIDKYMLQDKAADSTSSV